ncbi:MAG: hypothetical protein IKB73_00405, partial [Ruminococcus sp.]|nr:hypothetical protein [Ruminococcus sp.]
PELLIFNGAGYMAGNLIYVYAVKNNSVVYVGSVGSRACNMFYDMNSSYRGLYCQDGNMGYYGCTYYYMKDYKIVHSNVMATIVTGTNIKTEVYNSTLYNAYKKATKPQGSNYYNLGLRQPNSYLMQYTWNQIYYGIGWNGFVGEYQYLAIPKITKVENLSGGARLTWSSVKGAEKYRVYIKNGSSWTNIGTTTSTKFDHKISKSNSTYTYTVRCLSGDAKRFTSSFNKTGVKNTYIAQPKITKFENVNGGTKITWSTVAGASKYRLFKKTNGSWAALTTTTATSYTHKISSSNTKTTYTVRCISSDLKKYTSSFNSSGYTNTYIAQPKITKFENVNGGTKITWSKVAGASKYRLFRKTASGWSGIATTTSTSYTYKISKSNTTNTYTVRCISSDNKKYTSSYNKTGYTYKYIATPQLKSISDTSSGVKLTFYKVSGAPKYRVYRKTSGESFTKLADVSNAYDYYVDKTAKKGVQYTYTVRCISFDGKSFVSGYNSTGLTITRK